MPRRYGLTFCIPALLVLCVLTLPFSGGGVLGKDKGPSPKRFPHSLHLADTSCLDCHETATSHKLAGYPSLDFCLECHDEQPEFDRTVMERSTQKSERAFSHKVHHKTKCQDCHDMGTRDTAGPRSPSVDDCQTCHGRRNVELKCVACHAASNFRPGYHGLDWPDSHGRRTERRHGLTHGWDCNACHRQETCVACHKVQKPRSHTAFFRGRGHGLHAEFSRESCSTCHEQSSCVRCHSQTKPMNHQGNWDIRHGLAVSGGKTGDPGKCAVCHNASWCAACHAR